MQTCTRILGHINVWSLMKLAMPVAHQEYCLKVMHTCSYVYIYGVFIIYFCTGWASPPRNLKAAIVYHSIENCSIIVSWEPPVYNGGLPVLCYRLVASYSEDDRQVANVQM